MSDAAEAELEPRDADALERCVALMRATGGDYARHIESMLRNQPWRQVARFCAYSLQCDSLALKPWQSPPAWGGTADAEALIARLEAVGASRYEPDPAAVLAQLERKVPKNDAKSATPTPPPRRDASGPRVRKTQAPRRRRA
jgi:hypothetical protein